LDTSELFETLGINIVNNTYKHAAFNPKKQWSCRNRHSHGETLLETEIFLYAKPHQGNSNIPSEKLILAAYQYANPDRDKMTKKIKLPVGVPIELFSLTRFF
jgi:hypothetical protein